MWKMALFVGLVLAAQICSIEPRAGFELTEGKTQATHGTYCVPYGFEVKLAHGPYYVPNGFEVKLAHGPYYVPNGFGVKLAHGLHYVPSCRQLA